MLVTAKDGNVFELKKTMMIHKKVVGGNGNSYRASRKDLRAALKSLDSFLIYSIFIYEFREPGRKTWTDSGAELRSYENLGLGLGCMYFKGGEAVKLRRWIKGRE